MRDYILVGFLLVNVPIGLIRPYWGLIIYTWMSYMYPNMLAWDFAVRFPGAKLAAAATAIGTLVTRDCDFAPLRQRENIAMILLWGTFTISGFFAIDPAAAWIKWQEVSKLIIMALLTATLLTTQLRVRWFLIVVGLSIGFYGAKGGLFSVLTGGEARVWGPGTSIIAANNALGLALNMCLPILWYLAHEEKRGPLKYILYGTFFLSVPSIMFTYSRASALTLPIILAAIIFKGRSRVLLAGALIFGILVAIPFIPQQWWDRQMTTVTYEQDASAMSRIDNWRMCWRLAVDRPLTGGGFGFFTRDTFARYAPEFLLTYGGKQWDTHNIYFAVLAAHGFPAFFLFIGMIGMCFLSGIKIRRMIRGRSDLSWLGSYTKAAEISLLALLINGMFNNMEYFDLVYHWVAVVAVLKVLAIRAVGQTETDETNVYEMQPATATF